MKNVLFVISPEGFRDEELLQPKEVLEFRGASTKIASTRKGKATGKLGAVVEVEKEVAEINVDDFDAAVFVGGPGVEKFKLYENQDVLKLCSEFHNAGKLTAAICIGPRIPAMAGILKGKKATCFPDPSSIAMLKQKGALYTAEHVVQDGKVITADGPQAAWEFGERIANALEI